MSRPPKIDRNGIVRPSTPRPHESVGSEGGSSQHGTPRHDDSYVHDVEREHEPDTVNVPGHDPELTSPGHDRKDLP
jgi:hypothetical protein